MPSVTEAQSRRHFDEVASTWVHRYKTVPSFRTRLRVVADVAGHLLGATGDARVLDLGSGPCVLGAAVSALASVVVCVDTSWAMLHAGAVGEHQVEEILDGMGLDHRSDALVRVAGSTSALAGAIQRPFDLVLAVSVLEYQPDPGELLARLVEMVRPAGYIVFSVPNNRSIVRRVEGPIDALAARAGQLLGVDRLTHRSYSSTRPFGSDVPWAEALTAAGAICRDLVPLSLGDSGLRAALRPNWLVVAQAP